MKNSVMIYLTAGMLLLVSGCKKESVQAAFGEEGTGISRDLKRLQGNWCSIGEEAAYSCDLNVQGHTLRLSYKEASSTRTKKRNAIIKQVDVSEMKLWVYSDDRPWSYSFKGSSEEERLDIHFFDGAECKWVYVQLGRTAPRLLAGSRSKAQDPKIDTFLARADSRGENLNLRNAFSK